MEAMTPCDCRLSREAAMTCPRDSRGQLIWASLDKAPDGTPLGSMRVVSLDGSESAMLTFDTEWEHVSEGLARDHARIRHLDFVAAVNA